MSFSSSAFELSSSQTRKPYSSSDTRQPMTAAKTMRTALPSLVQMTTTNQTLVERIASGSAQKRTRRARRRGPLRRHACARRPHPKSAGVRTHKHLPKFADSLPGSVAALQRRGSETVSMETTTVRWIAESDFTTTGTYARF